MAATYHAESWSTLYTMLGGAAATLLGLLFLAVAQNLKSVMATHLLRRRAQKVIAGLASVLMASVLLLLPQPPSALGIELLAGGTIYAVTLIVSIVRSIGTLALSHSVRETVILACTLAGAASGYSIAAQRGPGLYLLLPALLVGLGTALHGAWSLLVASTPEH